MFKGGNSMMLDKERNNKIFCIFEINSKKNKEINEIVSFAANYWADLMNLEKDRQIGFEMGKGYIDLTAKELEKFKKSFINYVLKNFPANGSIMLWTSDGANFEDVGTDAYLPLIMKSCNLPLTCLPSDMCMWISENKIVVEDNFKQEVIYDTERKIKNGY